jgi:O-antigen/teichoic acid export membrane protein
VGSLACLAATRPKLLLRWRQVVPVWRRNASLGGWFFADQLFAVANGYFSNWLLACMLGTAATGAYAACISLVLFSNPFILGLSNVLMPRTARASAEGGIAEVHRVVRSATLVIVPVMAAFSSLLTVFSSQLLHLLYKGNYDGHGQIVAVLAWAGFISSLSIPLTYSFLAVERADVLPKTKVLRVAAGVAASVFLIRNCNDALMGAALGLLLGETVGVLSMFFYSHRVLAAVGRGRRPDSFAEPRL